MLSQEEINQHREVMLNESTLYEWVFEGGVDGKNSKFIQWGGAVISSTIAPLIIFFIYGTELWSDGFWLLIITVMIFCRLPGIYYCLITKFITTLKEVVFNTQKKKLFLILHINLSEGLHQLVFCCV